MSSELFPKTETKFETETFGNFSEKLRALVEHEQFLDEYNRNLYKRQTHIKTAMHLANGDHVTIYFNPHTSASESRNLDKPAECFVEIIPKVPKGSKAEGEFYKWYINQNPQEIYPDQADRIWEAINSFSPVGEESGGEA